MGISENWPASPVITEVMSTKAKGHQALVAIGLAGRSHFSASFTASTTQTDTILVEAAAGSQRDLNGLVLPIHLTKKYPPTVSLQ